jgi:predicted DNA-binding protein (MmcQ/YjbR family)
MDHRSLHDNAHRIALELPFTEHCWPFGPEYDVFKVGGKIFMLTATVRGRALVNLKCDPQKSLLHQAIYRSIEPGYHMNKKHWITVVPGEDISVDLLAELIDDSWNLIVDKLSKKEQRLRPGDFQRCAISVIAFLPLIICRHRCTLPSRNAPARGCKQ